MNLSSRIATLICGRESTTLATLRMVQRAGYRARSTDDAVSGLVPLVLELR